MDEFFVFTGNVKETIEDKVANFKPNWNYGWIKRQDVFSVSIKCQKNLRFQFDINLLQP